MHSLYERVPGSVFLMPQALQLPIDKGRMTSVFIDWSKTQSDFEPNIRYLMTRDLDSRSSLPDLASNLRKESMTPRAQQRFFMS